MNHKLKYLKLFEGLSKEEIPYSEIDGNGNLYINLPKTVKTIPPEYNQLTDEITGSISIEDNESLTEVTGFKNLTDVGWCLLIDRNKSITEISGFCNLKNIVYILSLDSNESLTKIAGFDNLIKVGDYLSITFNESITEITGFNNLEIINKNLYIYKNPKLVTMSIPGNLVRAVDYGRGYGIIYDNGLKFKSPSEFINSPEIMDDLVTKFNPGDHGDVVVKQIVENIEEWGTDDTKSKVYSFLGKYLTPEQLKLAPTHIQHHYHPDYQGTTGRDVAKVNSGEVYGIF